MVLIDQQPTNRKYTCNDDGMIKVCTMGLSRALNSLVQLTEPQTVWINEVIAIVVNYGQNWP